MQHEFREYAAPGEVAVGPAREESEIAEIVGRLKRRYPTIAEEDVVAITLRSYHSFADARVRIYVPLLTEREAGDQLRWLEGSSSSGSGTRPDGLGKFDGG